MDIEKLMEHVQIISSSAIAKWCREDEVRLELLAEAVDLGTVKFRTRGDGDMAFLRLAAAVKKTGQFHYTKVDAMRTMLLNEIVVFDAPSFREWYYSIWPKIETTDSSNMSKSLAIAFECYNALYADSTLADATIQTQNRRITKWFKDNHPEIPGSQLDHIRLVVKPD